MPHNGVRDAPAELGVLENLRKVDLSHNPVGSLPQTFSHHPMEINLSHCRFAELPDVEFPPGTREQAMKIILEGNPITTVSYYDTLFQSLYKTNSPVKNVDRLILGDNFGYSHSNLLSKIGFYSKKQRPNRQIVCAYRHRNRRVAG